MRQFAKADAIFDIFLDKAELDARTCLAICITTFQCVHKYQKMQQATKDAGKDIFQSYFATREAEQEFLPETAGIKYTVRPSMEHGSSNGKSIDAMGHLPSNYADLDLTHIKAEQYHNDKSIATSVTYWAVFQILPDYCK